MSVLERLDAETASQHADADADIGVLLASPMTGAYRRFLGRMYSFIRPLERSLAEARGLERYFDPRRLRKHLLLSHDLQTLGIKPHEIDSLPLCRSVPAFGSIQAALGWAYVVERTTLHHTTLFRHLASAIPGDVAFGSSYLKCYFGSVGEMWRSFGDGVDRAGETATHRDQMVAAARAAFRHWRRWRNTLDGKALSGPHDVQEPEEVAIAPQASGQLSLAIRDEP